jgi:hypothetical protein
MLIKICGRNQSATIVCLQGTNAAIAKKELIDNLNANFICRSISRSRVRPSSSCFILIE